MITVVGLGIKKGDLTQRGRAALKAAARVFSRSKVFVRSEPLAKKLKASSYAELDEMMARVILDAEKESGSVAYCALGDGYTDSLVAFLSERTTVEIVPGVSEYRGRKPGSTLLLQSAYDINEDTLFDTSIDLVVYGIDDALIAGEIKPFLAMAYGDEAECVFSSGDEQKIVALYEIDRMKGYKGASLFIAGEKDFTKKTRFGMSDLIAVMTRLTAPDGCPWDKAQTHESIRVNMLEEAYEAVDAINNGDIDNMREEMGDVLLQVIFHCDMAKRTGEFTLSDVLSELVEKLVHRHTHIFGENKATDSESALGFWEAAKAKEKSYSTLSEQLDRIPDAFPATLKIQKAVKKANKHGLNLTVDEVKSRLLQLLGEPVTKATAVDALYYAALLATLEGADGEVELAQKAQDMLEKLKAADKNKELDKAAKRI